MASKDTKLELLRHVPLFAGKRSEDRADGSVPGSDALASRLLASRVFTLRARPGVSFQVVAVDLGHGSGD